MSFLLASVKAFVVGGLFCIPAQILIDRTTLTPARVLVCYVVGGVAIGAVGLFEPLVAFAGAGASVPLVGFGGVIARGVRESVDAWGIIGALKGPLSAASSGVCAALVFGYLASLFTRARPKRLK